MGFKCVFDLEEGLLGIVSQLKILDSFVLRLPGLEGLAGFKKGSRCKQINCCRTLAIQVRFGGKGKGGEGAQLATAMDKSGN